MTTLLYLHTKYQKLEQLNTVLFKRLTGVKRSTFLVMTQILTASDAAKKARGGRASRLCLEDRLLMALEYNREYRTYFHVGQNYGVSESAAYKIIRWVEDTLIKDKRFALPGKKALLKSDVQYEVVLVDAAESPVERPKKDRSDTTPARRSATP
jgi:hypothetical protein